MEKAKGKVYLVGAGPGDPGLLTLRGREILEAADVVVYNKEVNPALLRYTNPTAELVNLNRPGANQDIDLLLTKLARAGKTVAQLISSDPLASATGVLIAEALQTNDVPFEIVPGVTKAAVVAAYAGVPVSHEDFAGGYLVMETQANPLELAYQTDMDWRGIAEANPTLLFQIGVQFVADLATQLMLGRKPPSTPAAVIQGGTTWQQKVVVGTLKTIGYEVQSAGFKGAVTVVIGETVKLRERLRWFDIAANRPLLGKRIVVTRAREQASGLVARLTGLGADAIEFAAFKIVPPLDLAPLDAAIAQLHTYDWVIFTSVNGPEFFMQRLHAAHKDARAFANAKICAIGPATAAALKKYNLQADLIPSKFVAESILESFATSSGVAGTRFLLARADVARENLADGLTAMGGLVNEVTAYRQVLADENGPTATSASQMLNLLQAGQLDAVLFTSSNTVRNFAKRLATVTDTPLNQLLGKTVVACIGPITSAAARDEYNLDVTLEAPEFTIDRLVESLVEFFTREDIKVT